jgi:uncharacterized protein (TIGR03435 family)
MKSIAAGLILVSSMGLSQSETPAFEVASVKRVVLPPGMFAFTSGPANPQTSGNRVAFSYVNLRALVMFSYGVTDKQISIPKEVTIPNEIYDIAAVAPGEAAPGTDQIRLMVQKLLAERFQMKLRRETAEVSVYNLMLGKTGSKLKVSSPETKSGIINKNVVDDSTREARFRFELSHEPVSELVRVLSLAITDGPVLDKTGLTGAYDFTLEFARDPFGASAKAAVQEQLGLRLESAREMMDKLLIESVQKPSEN